MNEDREALERFSGLAKLFPLPNLVLFPNVVQPLHIFEPRYRQLMADALKTDRLITLVLLQPGWESDYDAQPAIYDIACLGRIVADHQLPDGRYNLLLRGIGRVRLTEELDTGKLYRTCRAQWLMDEPITDTALAVNLRRQLAELVIPRFSNSPATRAQLTELFAGEMGLGDIVDILSFALPMPIESKQELLEAINVSERARLLMRIIETGQPPQPEPAVVYANRKFPPDFSLN